MKLRTPIIIAAVAILLSVLLAGPIAQTLTYAALQVANTFTVLQTFSSGIVVSPSTATPGNRIGLAANDTAFALNPNCSNSGTANELTILDRDETAADDWTLCDGTSQLFDIPNTGSDVVADTEILVGGATGGSATWVPVSGQATMDNTGAFTITAAGKNVKMYEFDGDPNMTTTSGMRFPNGSLSTSFEAANEIRFILSPTRPPIYFSGMRQTMSEMCPGGKWTDSTGVTLLLDNVYFYPFYVADQITIDALGFRLSTGTGAADTAEIGVYDSTSAGLPRDLLVETTGAGLSIQSIASVEDTGITPTSLDPGWHWFSYLADATVDLEGAQAKRCRAIGIAAIGDQATRHNFIKTALFSGGLPDPAPALVLADLEGTASTTPDIPYIWYRIQ